MNRPQTPDDLIDLANSFFAPRALLAAARAGVFGVLAEGRRTASEVARACNLDERATDLLLHALAAMGVIERDRVGPTFALGELGRECLAPGSPRNLVPYLRLDADTFEAWARFDEALRTGNPVEISSRTAEASPAKHRDFILAMRSTARGNAPLVADRLDLAAL